MGKTTKYILIGLGALIVLLIIGKATGYNRQATVNAGCC
jgi:uncharacterized membrane protein YuzA (DUF378 family)